LGGENWFRDHVARVSLEAMSTREGRDSSLHSGPGGLWWASAVFFGVGLLNLLGARSTTFVHGEELAWITAYAFSLGLSVVSLSLAAAHVVVRRRRLTTISWLPLAVSLCLVAWLVAYLYFDAFRGV